MRDAVRALGVVCLAAGAVAALAQTAPSPSKPTGGASAPTVAPTAIGPGCEDDPPEPSPCESYRCVNGVWVPGLKAAGSVCNDSNACTYGDACNSAGLCRGTNVKALCDSLCKACNGTASCGSTPAVAGTVCRPAAAPPGCDKAETCTGTTMVCPADNSQGWAPVGTACSSVPGFDTGCGCTSTGACAGKSPATGAQAVTGICWDTRGNMSARYVAPPGAACKTACPSP